MKLWGFDATIPVVHLPDYYDETKRGAFLERLEKAMHEVGFFALTGAGVDPAILDTAYEEAKAFFALDAESKRAYMGPNGQRGYSPGESAKGESRVDCKEFYHIGRNMSEEHAAKYGIGKNIWPIEPRGFEPSMTALYEAMQECALVVSDSITDVIGEGKGYIREMIREGDNLMRAIHYPGNPPKDSIWAAEHTDIVLFTILPKATALGLQVLNKEGVWVNVVVPDGAFIINCGDMLENLTNGYCRSAYHRVVDPGFGEERYSLVFFVHPKSEDRLDPLPQMVAKTGGVRLYANVNRIELLAERLIDLGLASRSLMEFFVHSGAVEKLEEVGRFSLKAKEKLIQEGLLSR